jgi:glycosyltransferase involved in cell wall biosynthesis
VPTQDQGTPTSEAETGRQKPDDSSAWGVSVILCCHNSERRLPPTLAHLAAQKVEPGLPWEVVVVDNASTDGTSVAARSAWPEDGPAPLRVVHEPEAGLSNARRRGFAEAGYEIVSFVDDDNWVCSDWVQRVAEIMSRHPEVGACAGLIEAVYEAPPPNSVLRFIRRYAVGDQGQGEGDVTDTRGWLWGAGLTTRRSAWRALTASGFRTLLAGRQGEKLTAGEDVEICWVLRLAGWRLWYDPRLTMRHCLPASRLTWRYLRGLYRGFGAADVGLVPYRYALGEETSGLKSSLKRGWQVQALASLWRLLRHGHTLVRFCSPSDGDAAVLEIERDLGRFLEVLRQRETFNRRVRDVRAAVWLPARTTSTGSAGAVFNGGGH